MSGVVEPSVELIKRLGRDFAKERARFEAQETREEAIFVAYVAGANQGMRVASLIAGKPIVNRPPEPENAPDHP